MGLPARHNAISLLALLSLLCACVVSGQQVHPNVGKAKMPVKPAGGKAKLPVRPAGGKGKVAVKPAGGKGKGKMPAMAGGVGGKRAAVPVGAALVPGFKKFVDPLFIPPVIDMREEQKKQPGGEGPLVTISAYSTTWKYHRNLPPTKVYAFGRSKAEATVPGPTIVVESGSPIRVEWVNNITDDNHFLPVDHTLMAPMLKKGGVPIVVHVHGAKDQSTSDGYPDAWYTARGEHGPLYKTNIYSYPNTQPASTNWYHDHVTGITRLNVAAGMAGLFVVKDAKTEDAFNLPSGEFDIPLLLQDRSFLANGALAFPHRGMNPHVHPFWSSEYFGNSLLVNGKVHPYLEVLPRKYRFRVVNGANARFFTIHLYHSLPGIRRSAASQKKAHSSSVLPMTIIATDSAYRNAPLNVRWLRLGPGERAEVIVDFTGYPAGAEVEMTNSAAAPFPAGDAPQGALRHVMQFRVKAPPAGFADTSRVPPVLNSIPPLNPKIASNWNNPRKIYLSESLDSKTKLPLVGVINHLHWRAPVQISPKFGDFELWEIINWTEDAHPLHIHFAPHQVVRRRMFDHEYHEHNLCQMKEKASVGLFGRSCWQGAWEPAYDYEQGLKDTTQVLPNQVVTLLMDFRGGPGMVGFNATEGPGYVLHCHILDHEDNDMMRPYKLHN